jgi:hypothetical protein
MADNDSFNQGLHGTGPTGNTNWDDYQRGKSIRDWNQQALSPQGSNPGLGLLGGDTSSAAQPMPRGPSFDFQKLGDVLRGTTEDGYEILPVLPGVPGIAAALLISPVVLILLPVWGVLYPLSGAAVLIGAMATGKFVGAAASTLKPDDIRVFSMTAGAVLVFACTRIEQVFSRIRLYRYVRYAMRFVTYGFVATAMLLPGPGISGWVRSPELASAILRDPRSLAVVGAITLAMQWFSMRRGPRRMWHLLLATAKLRSPVER